VVGATSGRGRFEARLAGRVALSSPLDVAVISLDLGEKYAHKKRWHDLDAMADQTMELLEGVPGTSAAVTAYRLWRNAIRARQSRRMPELAARCRPELMRA
jgi:hypothetical protein